MGVLAEYMRKEADQLRAELMRRRENLEEWLTALTKLYDQLEGWIREADAGLGLLGISRDTTKEMISEPRLGNYELNGMWIVLGAGLGAARQAWIVPKARYVAAVIQPPGRAPRRADGIVQIKQLSIPEYYLFRWKGDASDEWFIRSVSAWNANPGDNAVEPLDRDRFEAAMLQVLQ